MTRKQRRLAFIGLALATLGLALGIALYALRDSISYYQTPTELKAKAASISPKTRIRTGGLVKEGSLVRGPGEKAAFTITDLDSDLPAVYEGVTPDMFKENQGVVAEGFLENGVLKADVVLAKHDEKYIPKEVADALKQKGLYKGQSGGAGGRP